MEEKLSWSILKPHLRNLRACGIYHLDPSVPALRRYLHTIFMRCSISLSSIYAFQEIIYIYNVRDNTDKVIDSMFLLLSFLDSIYKQIVMLRRSDQIEVSIDILKGPYFNQDVLSQNNLLIERAKSAKRILRVYNLLTLTTCVLWTLFPVMRYLNGHDVELAIWLPFETSKTPQFCIAIIYNYLQTSFLGFNDSTMDSFVSVFLAQCKTQLYILRHDLEVLVEKSMTISKENSIPIDRAFELLFKKCLGHYNDIVRLSNKTMQVFGDVILFQFLVTGWIICTTAYRAINMDPASLEFFSMLFYMSCILVQIYLYCYYGNEITFESKRLSESAYKMNWLKMSAYQKKSLIIFMERIKRPIEPKAGFIIPLSAKTYITILRSSYTFYTVLKSTD